MNVYVDHKQVYGMSCTKASKQRGMMNTAGVHVGTVEQSAYNTVQYSRCGPRVRMHEIFPRNNLY